MTVNALTHFRSQIRFDMFCERLDRLRSETRKLLEGKRINGGGWVPQELAREGVRRRLGAHKLSGAAIQARLIGSVTCIQRASRKALMVRRYKNRQARLQLARVLTGRASEFTYLGRYTGPSTITEMVRSLPREEWADAFHRTWVLLKGLYALLNRGGGYQR